MLLLSLLWVWIAWNAYHPWKGRPAFMSIASFIFGFLAGEMGLHLIATQLALTLLIVWFGELSGFTDALALTISMFSWLALGLFYFRAQRAEPIMAQAVNYALGRSADSPISFDGLVSYEPDLQRLKNPFAFKRPGIQCERDIVYHAGESGDLHLDIYSPKTPTANAPVLLQIHGGAWIIGKRGQQAQPLIGQLTENGWICVDVQYRLSPAATFPDHIIDCKRALRWVKEHIREFGGDPEFIVVTGGSAGGHLSSLLCLSANSPEYQPGFEDADTTVQGCVPFYGVYDFLNSQGQRQDSGLEELVADKVFKKTISEDEQAWQLASPLFRVRKDAPPFLILHGEADTLVGVEEGQLLYKAMRETSEQAVGYAEFPDAQHAFDLVISLRSQIVANYLTYYLSELHKGFLRKESTTSS
ncbi:alpha/beta hydrolase [Spongiibacter sp. KMU-158]|uniref:Alpha/beta hydrolase n=1 Tax=Spongiibacter pelagi TaxID=2760804 RepID=A0A927GWV3_9GAMM|nr:alpha/beta hydrolase [Spongiibacter pelagi]MBD2859503.1 alpha/beta hydrolase [Spongiibacter pelagi]